MHGARIPHEVGAGPGMRGEEVVWKEVTLQPVTAIAREDNVARMMRAAVRERIDMVERRRVEVEGGGAVNAAPAAVAHGRAFDGALVPGAAELIGAWPPGATWEVGKAWKHDAVTLSTNGHFTSREKATPRDRRSSHRGASTLPPEMHSCGKPGRLSYRRWAGRS